MNYEFLLLEIRLQRGKHSVSPIFIFFYYYWLSIVKSLSQSVFGLFRPKKINIDRAKCTRNNESSVNL